MIYTKPLNEMIYGFAKFSDSVGDGVLDVPRDTPQFYSPNGELYCYAVLLCFA